MMNTPLVSVIMPAYNASHFIEEAIKSILNQSFSRFELIVIDDCSSDDTYKIAKSYATNDKRIRIFKNKRNLRIAGTLNRGIELSKAKFIARMDADDISFPKRLELQYNVLSKNRNIAIVGANMEIINERGVNVSRREYPSSSIKLKKVMFRYSPFAHPVVMYRKDSVLSFGGYDENKIPCEDIDLWFKLGSKHNFYSINKYLLKYRVLPNYSSKYNLKYIEKLGFQIKIEAIKKYGYKPNLYDVMYNISQYLTLWVMPTKLRINLYDLLRTSKII